MDQNIDDNRPQVYEAGELKYHIEVVLLDSMRQYVAAAVLAERERLMPLLAHAVKEADGWHDDSRGGPIEGDAIMDAARAAIHEGESV